MNDEKYTEKNCREIEKVRKYTAKELKKLGFEVTDSKTNFVFAKHPDFSGEKIYSQLKCRGILVRHFDKDKIADYNRITIGTKKQMITLIDTLSKILEEC